MRATHIAAALLLAGCTGAQDSKGDWGDWGDTCEGRAFEGVDVSAAALFVDAAKHGDGSQEHPFGTIKKALAAAGTDDTILVAPGTYAESLTLAVAGVSLHGACVADTVVTATGGAALTQAMTADATATIGGLTLSGGAPGILLTEGTLVVADLAVEASADWGVVADGAVVLDATDLAISGTAAVSEEKDVGVGLYAVHDATVALTRPRLSGNMGGGLLAKTGGHVTAEGGDIGENTAFGVAGSGPDVVIGLHGTTIRDTLLGPPEELTYGLLGKSGATVTCSACVIERNAEVGVASLSGAEVTLDEGSTVHATVPSGDSAVGVGAYVVTAALHATDTVFSDNAGEGVWGLTAATLDFTRVTVSGTLPDGHDFGDGGALPGDGIVAQTGSVLTCSACTISGNTSSGLSLVDIATFASLTDGTVVSDTVYDERSENKVGGWGIQVSQGAMLTARGLTLSRNQNVGLYVRDVAEGGIPSWADITDLTVEDTTATTLNGSHRLYLALGAGAGDGGLLEVTNGTVSRTEGNAFVVAGGARLDVSGVDIADAYPPAESAGAGGLVATTTGVLVATDVSITRATGIAIDVDNAEATLTGVTVREQLIDPDEGGVAGGLLALNGGVVTATDLRFEDVPGGALLCENPGTTCTVTDLDVGGTWNPTGDDPAWAVFAGTEAHISLVGGRLHGNVGAGVLADRGALVELTGTTVEDEQRDSTFFIGQSLAAGNEGVLVASDVTVTRSEGPAAVALLGGTLTCDHCLFTDNAYAAAEVMNATLALTNGTVICGTAADELFGGGIGVLAAASADPDDAPTSLTLDDVEICAHPVAAVYVSGAGAYVINGSTLAGSAEGGGAIGPWGNALVATAGSESLGTTGSPGHWDGTTGLYVADSTLTGGADAAVFLSAATGTFCHNTWTGTTLLVQQLSDDPPDGCDDIAPLWPEWESALTYFYPRLGVADPSISGS